MIIRTNYVDLFGRRYFPAEVHVDNGIIEKVEPVAAVVQDFMIPGFVDAHIHIESSMLTPAHFAAMAVQHGTVATISDPHEIANVLGVDGVNYMIDEAKKSPLKIFYGAPSCVPATSFETAGAQIDASQIEALLARDDIWYLSEMMNFPGVLYEDEEVMLKIGHATRVGKPIDGHAPGLSGDHAIKYINTGISTDHECITYEEARHKLINGMKIIIREGSAAKNFDALIPLMKEFPDRLMFCSDDKHPDELILGHINQLAARAIALGYDPWDVLRAACINPVDHYGVPVGQLKIGDPADFIIVSDLESLGVKETWIAGRKVWDGHNTTFAPSEPDIVNNFEGHLIHPSDLSESNPRDTVSVIHALDGALVTERMEVRSEDIGSGDRDLLKIVVVNRYQPHKPAMATIHGFGLSRGALASSVAHDSHNVVAVGVDDDSIVKVVNAVMKARGGIAFSDGEGLDILPLPIAGLMSDRDGLWVANEYARIDQKVKELGRSKLSAPFMTLSFMALLVIPKLKLSDKGLFDGERFEFVS